MIKLYINEKKKMGRISPEIYGHFSEHLGRCIYEGLYVGEDSPIPNVKGIRTDVVEALREIRVPVLRWPGGCFADEYHWKDGIGPKEKRKKMVNTHWGGVVEDNSFGTHEFFELCEQIGCKAYVNGNVGSGTVRCAHGIMPVPAPATAALLTGVPIYGGAIQGELCTPTGAALLAHFADSFGEMPLMAVKDTGIGIGTKTFEQANCVRAFLGEEKEEMEDMILELVCNIDDMTPEALAFACTRLMELGALDVYTVAGTMKKGRPGHVLTVLCRPEKEEELARHILTQTTTNGLRVRRCGKYFLAPGMGKVRTRWGDVRVKTAKGYGITHMKPEYEDVAEVARRENLPYQRVEREVRKRLK